MMLEIHSLVLLCVCFYLIYKYLTRNFDYWKQRNVPYVKPSLLFGNICQVFFFQKQFTIRIAELYNQIQDSMVGIFILHQPFLIVKDPEIIKHVLVKDFDTFRNRSVYSNDNIDPFSANFMFFAEANIWKIFRTKTSPIFTSGKLKHLFGSIESIAKNFVNYLKEETLKDPILDAREVCARFSMDVIAGTNFGVDAACLKQKNADFYMVGRRMFNFSYENTIRLASYLVAPFLVKLTNLQAFDRHVSKYIKDLTTSQINFREENNHKYGDLIDVLVDFKRKNVMNDIIFGNNILYGQVGQFFFAGFETLTVSLSFGLYELALNPEIQKKVKTEIASVLREHEKINYDVIQYYLPYLDQVIKEVLRKYPPLSLLDRRCSTKYKIPNSDVILESGTPVYISVYGLHYDEKYYPNPQKFDPERFSKENEQNISDYFYLPFGNGPRNCIGKRYSLIVLKLALIKILSEFEIETCKNTPLKIEFSPKSLTLVPRNNLYLKFKKSLTDF